MRLQLTLVAFTALSLLAADPAVAQEDDPWSGESTARLLIYSDDDETTVVTSVVDAEVVVPANVTIGAHALIDVVSSASVDVVSAATGRWDETRTEVGGRVRGMVANTGVGATLVHSQENDWRSMSASVSADRELFERNLRLAISYALSLNDVGRAMDPTFERSVTSHSGEVSVAQLIDPYTRVGGAITAQRLSGFLASPYRTVAALDGVRGPERHPETRLRAAASGYVVRALGDLFAARVSYRFYRDDWGIASHTGLARINGELYDRFIATLEGRAYWQNRADFYQPAYQTSFRYMSSDRELATFWNIGGSLKLGVRVGPFVADAKAGLVRYRFSNFPALPKRTALLIGGGLRASW